MLQFTHASRASQGARAYQEDAAAVWPGTGVLVPRGSPPADTALVAVLSDGMGGHAGGALASTIACGMFLQQFAAGDGDGVSRLGPCLHVANRAIRDKAAANPALEGMGATLVGVAIGPAGLSWISVGDSPMYLFRRGELVQINADHSLAPVLDRMAAEGKMTVEAARADPRRHYLRSAVTGEDLELIDASERPLVLADGDIVLVSSDGIHTLEADDIRRVIGAYKEDGPDAIASALVRAVDSVGALHQDNTTVIVIAVKDA